MRNPTLKLINFRCPHQLIEDFDDILDSKYMSRTHVLLNLMEKYISEETDKRIEKQSLISKPQSHQQDNIVDDRSIFLQY